MFVVSWLTILFRCLMLIDLDNCEPLFLDNNEYIDFLQLYNMIKQHQLNYLPQRTTNNVYVVPIPILLSNINNELFHDYKEIKKTSNNNHDSNEAVFRDYEATFIDSEGKLNKKKEPQIKRKTLDETDEHIEFDPKNHKNWNLIPSTCGQSTTGDRITGGENASLGQYPWMARIGFINVNKKESLPMFRCGGSLITKKHIVTAAHCVSDLPPELSVYVVRLGEYNTETDVDCVNNRCADKIIDIKPKTIIVHENYGTPTARNDIAIIKLRNSIAFTEWVSPICLPHSDAMNADYKNQRGEVAGWGFYDISINKGSEILQTVQLPILTSEPCVKAFRGVLINYKKQLCVGGDLGKDSCNGDSGGPLMKVVSLDKEPKYVLLGIVSLGAKYCGLTTAPAIYTKITYYMAWILDNLK